MYSWVRYGVAIYLGLALAGAMGGPPAQGQGNDGILLWPGELRDKLEPPAKERLYQPPARRGGVEHYSRSDSVDVTRSACRPRAE